MMNNPSEVEQESYAMFDRLLQLYNSSVSPSVASKRALQGSARGDALAEAIHHYRPVRSSSAGRIAGLEDLKLEGISDHIIDLTNPYPKYNHHRQDFSDTNELNNDREMIRQLKDGRTNMLEPALAWVQNFSKRDRIKNRMDAGDDTTLAMALQKASFSGSDEAREIFTKECAPVLRRLMPEALVSADVALKQSVAKHLFKGICKDEHPEEHIALSTLSSVQLTANIIERFIRRGDKVILPIPYFDPFPVLLDKVGASIITTDTTHTDYKLKANDLRRLVDEHQLKKGSWLFLTTPNNATMTRYSQEEMQAIADVVAEKGLNVICDELYARLSNEPHVSLASLDSYGPDGVVHMRDKVITITGCSKQFPFGSDNRRKLGAALFPDPGDARLIEDRIRMGRTEVSDHNADIYRTLIETTPGRVRAECCATNIKDQDKLAEIIGTLNDKYGRDGARPLEVISSPGGYLACLKLNNEWAEKSGIRTSENFADYLFAVTGLSTKSMLAEGVTDPVIRFNMNHFVEYGAEIQHRLDGMLAGIAEGKAPRMDRVTHAVDKLVERSPQVSAAQVRYATQRT